MNISFYGNTLVQWLSAAAVAAGSMVLLWAVGKLVIRRLGELASRTATNIDDLVTELLQKTKFLFVLLVGIWAGSLTLSLSPGVEDTIGQVLIIGLLLQGAFWATGVVNFLLEQLRASQTELDPEAATAMGALGFIARLVVWSLFLLLVLSNLGINITSLVAGLGIGGIAVALALQNVLGDLFASLSIVLDKPFVVGDFIIVDDLMGTVEHVGLKTTRVRSLGGEQLVFANSDLLGSRVRNYKRMEERRILFTIGVTYDTGYDHLKEIPEIIRAAVESQDKTRFDRAHFKSFGDSSLVFETVYFMLVPEYNVYMDVQQAINLELYWAFEQKGIDFAFPTRTLHVERSGAPAGFDGFEDSNADRSGAPVEAT